MRLKIANLDEMIRCKEYQSYESDTLLNIQYHIINTDKDVDEMIEYNNDGMFGCTHGEFIECWRDFLNTLKVYDPKYDDIEEYKYCDITIDVYDKIWGEIERCETWHMQHLTLEETI